MTPHIPLADDDTTIPGLDAAADLAHRLKVYQVAAYLTLQQQDALDLADAVYGDDLEWVSEVAVPKEVPGPAALPVADPWSWQDAKLSRCGQCGAWLYGTAPCSTGEIAEGADGSG